MDRKEKLHTLKCVVDTLFALSFKYIFDQSCYLFGGKA